MSPRPMPTDRNQSRRPRMEREKPDLTPKPYVNTPGKVNVDVAKRPGERNEVLLRRFSREMLLSETATEWKDRKEFHRPISRRKRREIAIRYEKNRKIRRGY